MGDSPISSNSKTALLWIHDIDDTETLALTDFGIETLREIISDQIDRDG